MLTKFPLPSRLRTPEMLLMLMAAAAPLSFATWSALIGNYSVEVGGFNGAQYGVLQSVREVPGFLAFAVVFVLLLMREQTLAIVSLLLLGVGVAASGAFHTPFGLYLVTFLMSVGFHYHQTMQNSLTLQWSATSETPHLLGKLIAVGSFASLLAFGLVYVCLRALDVSYGAVYLLGGGLTCVIAALAHFAYPHFAAKRRQRKKLILRKRYWLYYLLTFLSGARRQIFVVFAGFLMIEKFSYSASDLTLLFLINCGLNIWLAPAIGKWVGRFGERRALLIEYAGLTVIFTGYAFVQSAALAAVLYIVDHLFFALALALQSYFQKIAHRADIAATAGVSFTINHIAAVALPATLGVVWLTSKPAVFLCGAALGLASLLLSCLVPLAPARGNEVRAVIASRAAVMR